MTVRLEPIIAAATASYAERGWPWNVIGVFPAEQDVLGGRDRADSGFLYTVGLDSFEVWMPVVSIEGRHLGFDFGAVLVNAIAFGTRDAVLNPGDDATIALGIAGADGQWERDADGVFWIGAIEDAGRRQTFQSTAQFTLPVRWSSPLGWREEP